MSTVEEPRTTHPNDPVNVELAAAIDELRAVHERLCRIPLDGPRPRPEGSFVLDWASHIADRAGLLFPGDEFIVGSCGPLPVDEIPRTVAA